MGERGDDIALLYAKTERELPFRLWIYFEVSKHLEPVRIRIQLLRTAS